MHFFGKKGNQDLHYEGFYKFMDNLQTEVLELEFYEFSKGNLAITEVDFAKILLRYTYLVNDAESQGIKIFHNRKFFCCCWYRILMNMICSWTVYWIG